MMTDGRAGEGDWRVTPDWRYIADDGVRAAFGLAADEVLARRQGTGASPPTLRLYTYASHCALVGRFQRAAAELRLDECRALGIEVNRRPTGGGAIIMGADQLGVALAMPSPATAERTYETTRALFARLAAGLVGALGELGIEAEYRRKNDLEVGGRKIAGLGLYFDKGGGLLFHASLLVDLDVALMLRVLATPLAKLSDKAIRTVSERISTVRRETGRAVPLAEVRDLARAHYEQALGVRLVAGRFTAEERAEIAALEAERYATAAWLEREPAVPDTTGSATVKTAAGLVSAHLTLAGNVIKAVYLTGDFFADEAALARIERALRWHAADPARMTVTLEAVAAEGAGLPGIAPAEIAGLVAAAAEASRRGEQAALGKGCFIPADALAGSGAMPAGGGATLAGE